MGLGFWIYLVLLAALLWVIIKLAKETNLLRDSYPADPGKPSTFSLSKCQMAFWFVVVLASFCFIWLATGAVDTLSSSALALLAISGGTGLVATLIDRSKQASEQKALEAAHAEQATIIEGIKDSGGVPGPTQTQELATAQNNIASASSQLTPLASEGFLKDVLTDANGIAIHRLQIFVWTIVLGVIFAVSVYQGLSMPELSGTLLGLMGISSATYLGLKAPEKQT